MKVDRDRFLEEGYLILRQVIPPSDLERVRAASERLLEKQKEAWRRDRDPGDPPGGQWEISSQPRVTVQDIAGSVDAGCIPCIEIWHHENIQGVSSELLGVADAGVTEMMMMCSPVRDHGTGGHRGWHRDLYPPFSAPVQAFAEDILENGPRYVQWNIPLYDDDVLWVMPGSHKRLNTAEENRLLAGDERVPFPGGVQTDLKAGDGVVYILPILHWGSRYDRTLRRTLHGGFSTHTQVRDLSYAEHLSAPARERFERWNRRSGRTQDLTEAALRAAIAGDGARYREVLDQLHPGRGARGEALTTVYMSKSARRIYDLRGPGAGKVPESRRNMALFEHPITLHWGGEFAGRFCPEEAEALWERLRPVEEGVQAEEELAPPGYEDRPSRYYFYEMPAGLDIAAEIDRWN
ncbi:MAG: phytanoyl-CoA dioxygenase family protein [Gemmatimonadetes bacterium]|nr:phytanoyl-CoA dioxygenase family protein [Gemmatimonadota bacterium]